MGTNVYLAYIKKILDILLISKFVFYYRTKVTWFKKA